MILASALAVLGLVVIHLLASRIRFIDVIPRSRFLSLSGGMSVAYVFLRILPDLGNTQLRMGTQVEQALRIPRHPIYLVALAGLIVFYGLQRLADRSRQRQRETGGEDCPSPAVFWISISSYSVVNFAVGYLLLQQNVVAFRRLSLFFLAMALWFVVNDYGLRVEYKERYHDVGRWILSAAVALGWLTSLVAPVPELVLSLALAFVAGGVVMNVLKEELPRERESRFWAFALGAALYSTLLLTL